MRRPTPPSSTHERPNEGASGATALPPAPPAPLAPPSGDDEPTIAEVQPPDSMTAVPPTLRPSAATVRPPPGRRRGAEVVAAFFWSAVAIGFGASSAAVWWELEVESQAHAARDGASAVVTRLPETVTWIQGASLMGTQATEIAAKVPEVLSDPEAPSDVPSCARRFFAPETFSADETLDALCEETDLRNVRERVHRAVVRHAAGAETAALVSWGTLGWYQLPLLAAARHACCDDGGHATVLPRQHGLCDGLGASVDTLATTALACSGGPTCEGRADEGRADDPTSSAARVTAEGREFAGRVQCLHRQGREDAFGYRFRPSHQNRTEFERRLRLATTGSPD